MKAIAYNIKPNEKEWLVLANYKKHDITIIANSLTADTIPFATGKEALLVFNNDVLSNELLTGLRDLGIKYIATSSIETSHLDLQVADLLGIKVANVPLGSIDFNPKQRMDQVIRNLDQWAAGKCLGTACCCRKECAPVKKVK
ncbi:lactate dehydrogenase [Pedobacter changchengzhani]|uniref:Lactate dehydrogenase n=1 Tax=Pedobacter changchengzhani TaxID=2529274 RepID=A0A4R5MLN3_9SPHI|nr:lactate dehydrogenase [Pedobacter changchengzhani]TDG36630.1 lactate dehydrogenase [Pedobacter changchengzhani]